MFSGFLRQALMLLLVCSGGRYPDVARQVVGQFPNIKMVATTLRQSLSASFNRWGAMLYDAQSDQPFFSPTNDGKVYQPLKLGTLSTVLVVEIRSLLD